MNGPPDPNPHIMPPPKPAPAPVVELWVPIRGNPYIQKNTVTGKLRTNLPTPP